MGDQGYRSPAIRSIIIGILLFSLLLLVMCSLSQVVKVIGAPFLYLPEKLGLIRVVHRDEVHALNLSSSPSALEITRPGAYAVFTANGDLLEITNLLVDSGGAPWLLITPPANTGPVTVKFVARGLLPYDTLFAEGRPIFTFTTLAPGQYLLIHPRRDATIYIVPDYTTGMETILWLCYAVQLLILATPFALLYHRNRLQRRKPVEEFRKLRTPSVEAFWEAAERRRKEEEARKRQG